MSQPIEDKPYNEYQNFAFHPHNILLTLLLFSLSILFLSLSGAFIYTRIQNGLPPVKLPLLFALNTLILVASSWSMLQAKKAYLDDNTERYQLMLVVTIVLSLLFMVAQFQAWVQLFEHQIYIDSDPSAGYLYVISGLHFAHVIGGLPFLILFLWRAYKDMREPVSVLVYFSDPEKRLRLRLLTIYWHFLDILWIYLVLFFYINYLVQ